MDLILALGFGLLVVLVLVLQQVPVDEQLRGAAYEWDFIGCLRERELRTCERKFVHAQHGAGKRESEDGHCVI